MDEHPIPEAEIEELRKRFTYHAPRPDQIQRYGELRALALDLAMRITQLCPLSRERSVALTKLDEVVMWANASIARREVSAEGEVAGPF